VKTGIRRFAKPISEAVSRDANEGDTRLLVTDILCDVLGYDKYNELTTEYQVRGEFADYGIRIDQDLVAFLECKRATTKLTPKHLRQVEMYAVNEGVEWLILTNAHAWQVYHLTPGMPVRIDLAFEADLIESADPPAKRADKLFFLSRESLKRRQIDDLWMTQAATAPKMLAQALLSESMLSALRAEVWRRSRRRVDNRHLAEVLATGVIQPEALTK
jgi:predicted type IV restriction endonuclease